VNIVVVDLDDHDRRVGYHAAHEGDGHGESAGATDLSGELLELYRTNEDTEIREAILNALWMRGEVRPLIGLYEETDDPELRRRIVQALSMVSDDEAIDFLIRIIEQ
jgi:hypothetical protein